MRVKDLFVEKTGGSIDVFLSSDGQSIPLGRNWVHRVQEALEYAALMIVFVTPNSLRSNWLFFESGFPYAKGIRVVPVGFLGVDLATLPPPLSLLQGFNITSAEGLNNLIAVANDAFTHKHPTSFTPAEFGELVDSTQPQSTKVFGNYGPLVDEVHLKMEQEEQQLSCSPIDAAAQIAKLLAAEHIEHQHTDGKIRLHGLSIYTEEKPPTLNAVIDAHVADFAFPLLEKAIRQIRADGVKGVAFRIEFVSSVRCIEQHHKTTGRMFGTNVRLGTGNELISGDLQFHLVRMMRFYGMANRQYGPTYVTIKLLLDRIPLDEIRELLAILFDRGLLYLETDFSYQDF